MDKQIDIKVVAHSRINNIPADEWDACAEGESAQGETCDPFTTHRFLLALENSGSISHEAGWIPHHLMVKENDKCIAVMPLYIKLNNLGEFNFDYVWAHEYEKLGRQYYPKLLSAVPFTPATGRRFLVKPKGQLIGTGALVKALKSLVINSSLSSANINFCTEEEAAKGKKYGLLHRLGLQYRWVNKGYNNFEEFLGDLSARKRKNIRRERRGLAEFGGKVHLLTGNDLQEKHWDAFWQFYQDTGSRKWGTPYLSRDFFSIAGETLSKEILLILCECNGRYIAGALNFIGKNALFGRYWGCSEYHDFLHFELCYYQAIEFAIANKLELVEAGAGGEHKLARGYLPFATHSLHWVSDAQFNRSLEYYFEQERLEYTNGINYLEQTGPFKKDTRND
ncbi:MAG: GNAT family N-acetyltransferase [Rhodobacteraceae bacterium]|nr:GNAT family N-acetyltransferase [Paracoccaceae bacterium]